MKYLCLLVAFEAYISNPKSDRWEDVASSSSNHLLLLGVGVGNATTGKTTNTTGKTTKQGLAKSFFYSFSLLVIFGWKGKWCYIWRGSLCLMEIIDCKYKFNLANVSKSWTWQPVLYMSIFEIANSVLLKRDGKCHKLALITIYI